MTKKAPTQSLFQFYSQFDEDQTYENKSYEESSDCSSEYNESEYEEPLDMFYYIQNEFPKAIKKKMVSSYHDTYNNVVMSQININYCLGFNQSLNICDFKEDYDYKKQLLNRLFESTEYVIYSDYFDCDEDDLDRLHIQIPSLILKLNQQFKNSYCIVKNMNMYVGCISCDGATSCTYEITFASDWLNLFNFGLCESERQLFRFVEEYSENKMISMICDVPQGLIHSVRKTIPVFSYPTNVQFEYQ